MAKTVVGVWDCHLQLLIRCIVDYKYVDETADIARHYSVDWGCNASSPLALERRRSETSIDQWALTEPSILSDTVGSHSSDQFLPSRRPDSSTLAGYSPYRLGLSPGNPSSITSASPGYSHSSQASPGSRDLISQIENGLPSLDEHEACLMRYFVVQLAPWVGFCNLLDTETSRLTNDSPVRYMRWRKAFCMHSAITGSNMSTITERHLHRIGKTLEPSQKVLPRESSALRGQSPSEPHTRNRYPLPQRVYCALCISFRPFA